MERWTTCERGCVREERPGLGESHARVEDDDQCSPQTSQQARKDAGDLMERGAEG
jgi:hypothetical protein